MTLSSLLQLAESMAFLHVYLPLMVPCNAAGGLSYNHC